MADKSIRNLTTTRTTPNTDDYIALQKSDETTAAKITVANFVGSIASTDLSDTANIARVNTDNSFTAKQTITAETTAGAGNILDGKDSASATQFTVNDQGKADFKALEINSAYTMPTDAGTDTHVLTTNGAGAASWAAAGGGGGALTYTDTLVNTGRVLATTDIGNRLVTTSTGLVSMAMNTGVGVTTGETIRFQTRNIGRFYLTKGSGVTFVDEFGESLSNILIPLGNDVDITYQGSDTWAARDVKANIVHDGLVRVSSTTTTSVTSGTPTKLLGTMALDFGANIFDAGTSGNIKYVAASRYMYADLIVRGSISSDTAGVTVDFYIHDNTVTRANSKVSVYCAVANKPYPFYVSYPEQMTLNAEHGAYVDADSNCVLTGDFKVESRWKANP